MLKIFVTLFAGVFWASVAAAQTPEPSTLSPIEHMDAELVVTGADGSETSYSPAELETLPTYRLRTTTPWREEPADFDGVLLTDLLERHGLLELESIEVLAENDFRTVIPRAVWDSVPVLLATRVNGAALTRRERGPILFVIGAEDFARNPVVSESHLVWMAARIAPE